MKVHLKPLIGEIGTVAGYLWRKGWAERNAGNISVRITHMVFDDTYLMPVGRRIALSQPVPALSGEVFLVSVSESRMRHLAKDPEKYLMVIQMDGQGKSYQMYRSYRNSAAVTPTSELPTHLLLHGALKRRNSGEKVVLHAHVTPVIAFTHLPGMDSEEKINKVLFSMHPELHTYLPEGIGFVPMLPPGSEQIARATLKAFENRNAAVWEKHGVFAVGNTPEETFDTIDLVAKAAEIKLLIHGI